VVECKALQASQRGDGRAHALYGAGLTRTGSGRNLAAPRGRWGRCTAGAFLTDLSCPVSLASFGVANQPGNQTAQGESAGSPDSQSQQGDDGFGIRDSSVGYIDPAMPLNILRLRFDSSYDNNRPTRAEFFWAKPAGLGGPGVRLPEKSVDYQDLAAYAEHAWNGRFSVFAEIPVRFLEPQVNAPAAGLTNINAGFKWAFLSEPFRVATFEFRAYAPTGDVHVGLSNGLASVEPALLLYRRFNSGLIYEGELRYWVPIGGTDFAGDIVRYGSGFGYQIYGSERFRIWPVVEFVGWTVLSGKEAQPGPDGATVVRSAAGDTIVNAKFGLRTRVRNFGDFYTGYGRALTDQRWYANTFRLEFRLFY
jgi:hypothetical protein